MQPIQEELLRGAQAGQEAAIAALIARLMPVIRKGARDNRAPGLEFEDAVQEGLIGLFGAVRSYQAEKGPFVPYAVACIAHAQQDARRAATRQKHAPLNDRRRTGPRSARPCGAGHCQRNLCAGV